MFNFLKNKEKVDTYHDFLDGKEKGKFVAWQFTKDHFNTYVPRWIKYEHFEGFIHDKIHLYSQQGGNIIGGEYLGQKINENDWIVSDENDLIIIMNEEQFKSLEGTFIYGSDVVIKL